MIDLVKRIWKKFEKLLCITKRKTKNNAENIAIYTFRNNATTFTDETVAERGLMIIEDKRVTPNRAYAENVGKMMGGCAVFNTYASQIVDADTTIEDINNLFEPQN